MMTKREQFIIWLGDAHAMEVGIVTTLEKHIADAKGQPKVRAALTKHLAETKRHAQEMEKALASLGGSHPILKESVSKLGNLIAGLVTTAAPDTPVKNAIADFATEHFEIACYTLLISTATELGEKKIAAVCKAILKEEQAMAKTLSAQLLAINKAYLTTLGSDKVDRASKPASTDQPHRPRQATTAAPKRSASKVPPVRAAARAKR